MLYQPNERILPWIQTKDHLVLHTFCCFLQLYNEPLYNGTKGWNKKNCDYLSRSHDIDSTDFRRIFTGFVSLSVTLPRVRSSGRVWRLYMPLSPPPPPPPKIIIIGIHYNTIRLQVINQHKYLETEFCIIHDVPIHCPSPLYDPN